MRRRTRPEQHLRHLLVPARDTVPAVPRRGGEPRGQRGGGEPAQSVILPRIFQAAAPGQGEQDYAEFVHDCEFLGAHQRHGGAVLQAHVRSHHDLALDRVPLGPNGIRRSGYVGIDLLFSSIFRVYLYSTYSSFQSSLLLDVRKILWPPSHGERKLDLFLV